MKVAVVGIEGFPLGKKKIPDVRLDALKAALKPATTTYLQLELTGEQEIKDANGIVALETKKTDLALMDLELIETRLARSEDDAEKAFLQRIQKELEAEHFVSELTLSDTERSLVTTLNFATAKPILLLTQDESNDCENALQKICAATNTITFFTSNQKELRAWPLKQGLTALDAAGCIHSDIQRGFIKAEVFNFQDVEKLGDVRTAKSQAMRLEGKEYVVQDGDIVQFRFNV
ncbi:DUF933 domain-containing protein [Candidatus Omnitrophota bacterium]